MIKTKLGLGLAALGRPEYINIREENNIDKSIKAFQKNTFEMLDFAYKNGITYFDTAPSYGKGEEFLKLWNAKNNYKNVILGTKWGYTYVANWELNYKGKHEIKEHSLHKLREQWQESKNLLPKLKYYQVHSATFDSGILENTEVLQELHQLKKTHNLHIGISTSGENQKEVIEKALEICVDNELLFNSFQVTYNIFEQVTFEILERLKKENKKIIIKEALANGRIFKSDKNHIIRILAKKYNVGLDAVALRFVIDSLEPTYLLSGAFSKIQLEENLKVFDFELTKDETHQLKKVHMNPEEYWQERSALSWD